SWCAGVIWRAGGGAAGFAGTGSKHRLGLPASVTRGGRGIGFVDAGRGDEPVGYLQLRWPSPATGRHRCSTIGPVRRVSDRGSSCGGGRGLYGSFYGRGDGGSLGSVMAAGTGGISFARRGACPALARAPP